MNQVALSTGFYEICYEDIFGEKIDVLDKVQTKIHKDIVSEEDGKIIQKQFGDNGFSMNIPKLGMINKKLFRGIKKIPSGSEEAIQICKNIAYEHERKDLEEKREERSRQVDEEVKNEPKKEWVDVGKKLAEMTDDELGELHIEVKEYAEKYFRLLSQESKEKLYPQFRLVILNKRFNY